MRVIQQVFALTCIFWKAKGRPVPIEPEWTRVAAGKRCTKHCPYHAEDSGLLRCTLLGTAPKVVELVGRYM